MRYPILWLAALALAWPAHADPPRARIVSVGVDERIGVLALEVEGFPSDGAIEVRLVGRPTALPIVSRDGGRIAARLPEGLGWARYVVRVGTGAKPDDAGEMEFVVGIVGPTVSEN